jgi:hypothetical protein
MALREIEHLRELRQVEGHNYWKGVRSFVTEASRVESASLGLWEQTWPGMSGDTAPVCKETRAKYHPNGIGGVAMILAYYSTPRKPGKAILQTRAKWAMQEIMTEPETAPGQDAPRRIKGLDANGHWVEVVEGTNKVHAYQATEMLLETAYPASLFDMEGATQMQGHVNESSGTFVGLSINTAALLCLSFDTTQKYGDDLIDVDYHLMWSGPEITWNTMIKSQPAIWVVRQRQVYDKDNEPITDRFKDVNMLIPGKTEVTRNDVTVLEDYPAESRIGYPTDDFAQLQGLTKW